MRHWFYDDLTLDQLARKMLTACCFFCAARFSDTVLLDKSYPPDRASATTLASAREHPVQRWQSELHQGGGDGRGNYS